MAAPEHLAPSALGTKAYWDSLYTTELSNHAASPADTGTIWFDDAAAEDRVVSYLDSREERDQALAIEEKVDAVDPDFNEEGRVVGPAAEVRLNKKSSRVLDLGTGNGHMLFAMREAGWGGTLVGVDYSGKSVELARAVDAASRVQIEENKEGWRAVRFEEFDILSSTAESVDGLDWVPLEGFDLVLDKGTFDAVSLSGEVAPNGRRVCEGYAEKVKPLVKRGGLVLITSCNWTEEELKAWFKVKEGDEEGFVVEDRVKYPSFTFGGKSGQQVVTLCFKRNG